jgi:2-hydroxy-3-keto-5-methylthiopentenyl-1-phosphate phosphatase
VARIPSYAQKLTPTDLITYCENENVPFKTFENFSEILEMLKDIAAGNISVRDVAVGGGL